MQSQTCSFYCLEYANAELNVSDDELMADGIVSLHRAIDVHETIPLLKAVDTNAKRELKRRKRKNPDELDKNTDQLSLFE